MYALTITFNDKVEFEVQRESRNSILKTLSEKTPVDTMTIARLRKHGIAKIQYNNGIRVFEIKKVEVTRQRIDTKPK